MKKRLWIILISALSSIAIIGVIIAVIINSNKDDNKLTEKQFSNVLISFDSLNDLTIKEECLNDSSLNRNILLDQNKIKVMNSNKENDSIYYEISNDKYYRYYYEDYKWKKKEIDNTKLEYKLDLNFRQFIDSYNLLTYNHKLNEYSITNYNDYLTIKITITDNKIRSYYYKTVYEEYNYSFSYYGNTNVELPLDFEMAYDKLGYDEYANLFNASSFSYTMIYSDEVNNELVESYVITGACNENKMLELKAQNNSEYKFYYEINDSKLDKYYYDSDWILESSNQTDIKAFTQREIIDLDIIFNEFENFSFNELANSYSLNNIVYNHINYNSIDIILNDNILSYVSISYTVALNDVAHIYKKIYSFTDVNNTTVNK